jgi:hypothetical protein
MRYFWDWDNDGGMIPNIGVFNTGDEVAEAVANALKAAGYALKEVDDNQVKKTTLDTGESA